MGGDEVAHQVRSPGSAAGPATARLFLIAIGTPANGRASLGPIASAAARAPVGVDVDEGVDAPGRARRSAPATPRRARAAEISPERTRAASSATGRNISSCGHGARERPASLRDRDIRQAVETSANSEPDDAKSSPASRASSPSPPRSPSPTATGGALRYRGVDIEELVGAVPFEQVWGLLVDGTLAARPAARPSRTRSASTPATRASTCSRRWPCSRPQWGFGQLIDISDEQARDNLARASVMALSFVAQSARGIGQPPVPQREIDTAALDPRALPDPLARRGRPAPCQGDRRLLDLGRRARHERLDVHRPGGRLDRRRRRGRAQSAAVGALSAARCTAARRHAC